MSANQSAADTLNASRVDLVSLVEKGIPPRSYVPGAEGVIAQGKRYHCAAGAKTGKSLAFLVTAIDIVNAGGTVAVLDRENGSDETARRLDDILTARWRDAGLKDKVQKHFHYYAWPSVSLAWAKDTSYVEHFSDVDLAIFDSSRKHTSALGLNEDSSDDYARFTDSLIDPLMRAGVSTLILDNVGHNEQDRARGTIAKQDLCDVLWTLKATEPFGRHKRGSLELSTKLSRLGDDGSWEMVIGDGHFGRWETRVAGQQATNKKDSIGQEVLIVLGEVDVSLSATAIAERLGLKPDNRTLHRALKTLTFADAIERHSDKSYSIVCQRQNSGDNPTTDILSSSTPLPKGRGRSDNPTNAGCQPSLTAGNKENGRAKVSAAFIAEVSNPQDTSQ